jgi:F0F1-type ATP synthase membrane subunit c/vacuolar-type H+-ATPase subunit K
MTTAFGKDPLSTRGRLTALFAATVAMQLSYWPATVLVWADPGGDALVGWLVVGLGAVPFVLMLLAFASRHPQAPRAVLRGMALFIVVGLAVALVHVGAGVAAGYAAAGIAVMRTPDGRRVWPVRTAVVLAFASSLTLVSVVAPTLGLVLGAVLPFLTLEFADHLATTHDAAPRR